MFIRKLSKTNIQFKSLLNKTNLFKSNLLQKNFRNLQKKLSPLSTKLTKNLHINPSYNNIFENKIKINKQNFSSTNNPNITEDNILFLKKIDNFRNNGITYNLKNTEAISNHSGQIFAI